MKYSDRQRIHKIYDNAVKLCEYIRDNQVKKEDLLRETTLQWLVTTPLYNIGEHAYDLSAEEAQNKVDEYFEIVEAMDNQKKTIG